MAYKFDPEVEPGTVLIEVYPRRYVRIKNSSDPKDEGVLLQQDKIEIMEDGKIVKKWSGEKNGRMWVPARIANELTTVSPGDAKHNLGAIAALLETRSEAAARSKRKPMDKEGAGN